MGGVVLFMGGGTFHGGGWHIPGGDKDAPPTGSKTATSELKLSPGTTPAPPTSPAARLSMMFPYRFGITITSNWYGFDTSCNKAPEVCVAG